MDQQITLIGNLTGDPVLDYSSTGTPVARFRLAVNTPTKDPKVHEAVFIDCETWRNQGEHVVERVRKGDRIIVVGRLVDKSWTDDKGNRHSRLVFRVNEAGLSLLYPGPPPTPDVPPEED